MKITERFQKEQFGIDKGAVNGKAKTALGKGDIMMEKTIAKELESNTCPICYELMVPPNYSPTMLFPCGHTFCKGCVNIQNGHRKLTNCPFCRKKIQSHAVNILLQNLICTYTDNKHLLEKYGESLEE